MQPDLYSFYNIYNNIYNISFKILSTAQDNYATLHNLNTNENFEKADYESPWNPEAV